MEGELDLGWKARLRNRRSISDSESPTVSVPPSDATKLKFASTEPHPAGGESRAKCSLHQWHPYVRIGRRVDERELEPRNVGEDMNDTTNRGTARRSQRNVSHVKEEADELDSPMSSSLPLTRSLATPGRNLGPLHDDAPGAKETKSKELPEIRPVKRRSGRTGVHPALTNEIQSEPGGKRPVGRPRKMRPTLLSSHADLPMVTEEPPTEETMPTMEPEEHLSSTKENSRRSSPPTKRTRKTPNPPEKKRTQKVSSKNAGARSTQAKIVTPGDDVQHLERTKTVPFGVETETGMNSNHGIADRHEEQEEEKVEAGKAALDAPPDHGVHHVTAGNESHGTTTSLPPILPPPPAPAPARRRKDKRKCLWVMTISRGTGNRGAQTVPFAAYSSVEKVGR